MSQREISNAHFRPKRNQRELGTKDYSAITKVLEEPLRWFSNFTQLIQFSDQCSATKSKYEPFPSSAKYLGDLCATLPTILP